MNRVASRPSTAAPILAVLAIVLVMLGAYVGVYLWLGERVGVTDGRTGYHYVECQFQQEWACIVFAPATWVESKLRGVEVEPAYVRDAEFENY